MDLFVIISLAGLVIVFVIATIALSRIEAKRKKSLSGASEFDSVPLKLNKTVSRTSVKAKRLLSLEKRFTVTRRAIYLFLVLVGVGVVIVPFIGHIPSIMVSVLLASISVIIGIAARPFIENMICGLVLCFGKLTRIGDAVLVDGEYGVIEDVTLTHCIIKRWDWLRYVVPNSTMMNKEFVNYSIVDNNRWVYVEFYVDYSVDLKLVEEIAKRSPLDSGYFTGKETPRFWITDLKPEAIKCMVVAWATSPADGWMLSIDIRRALIDGFKENGVQTHLYRFNNQLENSVKD